MFARNQFFFGNAQLGFERKPNENGLSSADHQQGDIPRLTFSPRSSLLSPTQTQTQKKFFAQTLQKSV